MENSFGHIVSIGKTTAARLLPFQWLLMIAHVRSSAYRMDFCTAALTGMLFLTLSTTEKVWAQSTENVQPHSPPQSLIVVIGASGTPQFEISFYQWSERWVAAARETGVSVTVIGRHRGEVANEVSDYDRLRDAIHKENNDSQSELWIVLIGHGTFDRRAAKFNLRGPDLSADELNEWLKPIRRPIAIINCASASGAFIPVLASPNRIVVAATKSGTEVNFSRFGDYMSQAIADPAADLDKDNQTSLWEAFLMASRRTAEYYDSDGRIATEHALLDDNGDGNGVRADQFRGLSAIVKPSEAPPQDGRRAHQWHLVPNSLDSALPPEVKAERNRLELAVEQLRDRKGDLPRDDYLAELERLLVELAELNERQDRSAP
ncbi:hypothetical protein [Schlesneria sp. DSM 10557]|uniref:hypothetical protein n=1 Tax=Schlesneria sp. DSM 10557 TaxID=3044399 RepID=UPI0035A13EE3